MEYTTLSIGKQFQNIFCAISVYMASWLSVFDNSKE